MQKVLAIIGPTASGKTSIAASLLEKHGRVVLISCDSRKVYRYLDIGTAKPPPELRKHYRLIDIRDPSETYSAQDFARDAEREIKTALRSGQIPVVVGGTTLYYKALFEGFFSAPPVDLSLRRKLLERMEREGIEKLHEELKKVDPATAEKVHKRDWIRITRALEVYYQTGKPISVLRKEAKIIPAFEPLYLGVLRDRKDLYRRIEERVDRMIEAGLVEETRWLLDQGYSPDLPSLNTIGYREIIEHLQGKISLEEAVRLIKKRTKIFSRKQLYFMRNLKPEPQWLSPDEVLERALAFLYSI
ncbi:MAG: tRNA (adenosine(37)-N6)-dimethylallyltransferase MiaA [Candidatus Hydrothermae bacterium]|uniref:tRNA dimethylallyltransferase n=1 Tax=candidate division WOR-3 bacterium TaxID=2052148 RepID=A0A7C0XBA8_UNCW3|nr:tRNA (adenosine(37)-N6)-dimethylallyltransferase MiaA [Candidatus Hydrothermae bacterium]HDM90585.1 tRNA (adenosine(37)-N6)-dimethylallyltransferase MiaA [candidate division WOR-3 bacterium]